MSITKYVRIKNGTQKTTRKTKKNRSLWMYWGLKAEYAGNY